MHRTILLILLALGTVTARAQRTVNPANPYAYSANTGWLHAAAATTGAVRIGPCVCAGFIYSANCGWINLGNGQPQNGVQYSNTTGQDCGVNVLPDGRLRGLAWGANIGWINFEATGNPRIGTGGNFLTGYAWSAGTGWISFDTPQTDLALISGDADNDTIPDAWELQYAANLTVLGNKDSDGDGRNDPDEYAAGTDPTDPTDFLQIVSLSNPPGPFGALRWMSKGNRTYRVESSTDLQTWQTLATGIYGSDGTQTSWSVPRTPRIFFRVAALKPPAGE